TTQRNAEAAAGSTIFKLYCTYSSLSAFTLTGPAWEVTEMRGTAFLEARLARRKGREMETGRMGKTPAPNLSSHIVMINLVLIAFSQPALVQLMKES
ncbi:hypothetical protein RRG08_012085, partial [Elysia crispata]